MFAFNNKKSKGILVQRDIIICLFVGVTVNKLNFAQLFRGPIIPTLFHIQYNNRAHVHVNNKRV